LRQIILDTETTGLRVEEGHRLIEIGGLEMIDRKLTGKHFHQYINPLREVEAGAMAVHGITNAFLQDKPIFNTVATEFMDFISGAELVIHNASFDLSFINNELHLAQQGWKGVTEYCSVIDTLLIARQLHVGQRNSLDALCKRYGIDNSKRDLHGALLDAHLLAQVYLAMTGGQGSFFDSPNEQQSRTTKKSTVTVQAAPIQKHNLIILTADEQEISEHKKYLQNLKQQGKCLWLDD
jgi:DNA polymerase III subunit epsilon